MRSYLIDELTTADLKKIEKRLKDKGLASSLEGVFYLPVPEMFLTEEQKSHKESCGPYIVAIEIGRDFVKMELLVRGLGKLRCSCITYCNPELRLHLMDSLDDFIRELDIPV
ncbi:hypothetical protein [Desulfovibrio inopinatus]|uniref:hypothetical protein n=1 Tax=Desulfovibrio inopinatus TaxID=102109 RepID=UPI000403D00A|nr:hypothetical protein [Desulfovibrio inopinatus]